MPEVRHRKTNIKGTLDTDYTDETCERVLEAALTWPLPSARNSICIVNVALKNNENRRVGLEQHLRVATETFSVSSGN